jgi:hypothetical protein
MTGRNKEYSWNDVFIFRHGPDVWEIQHAPSRTDKSHIVTTEQAKQWMINYFNSAIDDMGGRG